MSDQLKEIHTDVKELVKQGVIHNEILRTHEARSLALQGAIEKTEARIVPIEKHVYLVALIFKGLGAITVGALIQWLVSLLHK